VATKPCSMATRLKQMVSGRRHTIAFGLKSGSRVTRTIPIPFREMVVSRVWSHSASFMICATSDLSYKAGNR